MLRVITLSFALYITSFSAYTKAKYRYEYNDRDHTLKENFKHFTGLFIVSWPLYFLSQPTEFNEDGSIDVYRENFGELVYDNDEPVWNWMVHPYSGSQLYLYFRANGYSRIDSFTMTFVQSAIFEFFVEIYTEPASIQDLYQTPVFGSLVGLVFEQSSLHLLNSDNIWKRSLGHLINPHSLLWYFEGKVLLTPEVSLKGDKFGLNLWAEF